MSGSNASDMSGRSPDRRKLIAVMHADMVGYSRLIGLDDVGTIERLRTLRRNLIDPAIEEHGGRIVQTGGDSLLIVFDSIDGAVRCAVKVQEQVPIHHGDQPPDRAIRFRVGINLGDAIADGTDLHGDAVNIAARLQAECPPGGICVSRSVRDHVHGRLDLAFKALGALDLKNIARPVEAFLTSCTDESAPSPLNRGQLGYSPLPGKPSIAVLPFSNMSGDPEQEYFSDGIAEDIITLLSKSRGLLVIARNSSFKYRGKKTHLKQFGSELGVRYVLEGSVRKVDSRVRVTAQLVDLSTEGHLWAERYDRDLVDIFAVQDNIAGNVFAAIRPTMEKAERERAARRPPDSLDAWECYHRGLWHYSLLDVEQNKQARAFLLRAIELDPGFAAAHSAIAITYFTEATLFETLGARPGLVQQAAAFARQSLVLDDSDATAHSVLAYILMLLGRREEAMAEADLAVALDQNCAWAFGARGNALAFRGLPSEAVESLQIAMRLSPYDPLVSRWQNHLARAHYFARDYEAAVLLASQVCRSHPTFRPVYRTLIAALGQVGRVQDARRVFAEAIARFGDIFPPLGTRMPELREDDFHHMVEGYRKSGNPVIS
jgi:adenylate cyclase